MLNGKSILITSSPSSLVITIYLYYVDRNKLKHLSIFSRDDLTCVWNLKIMKVN